MSWKWLLVLAEISARSRLIGVEENLDRQMAIWESYPNGSCSLRRGLEQLEIAFLHETEQEALVCVVLLRKSAWKRVISPSFSLE